MDFAKQQLLKYDWKEGDGLGKSQDGISTAIKPKLKMNKEGFGFCAGEEYTNDWWNRVYNEAASNIKIDKSKDGDETKIKKKKKHKHVEITTKKTKKLKKDDSTYENFCQEQTSELDNPEETKFSTITDEELFKACGGRTAHKGARHGLNLTGKLSRLEKQDAILLKQLSDPVQTKYNEDKEKT